MDLTPGQRTALQNLASKKAGKEVGFITIADARSLTNLGLAERVSSGWRITVEGEALLASPPLVPRAGFTPHEGR